MLEERNREGATVFLSSHVLSEVGRYCKNAAVIREGKLLISDSVRGLAHTGVKRVTLKGVSALPQSEKVRDVKWENDTVSFLYGGEVGMLIKELALLEFEDINVSDPDLEEVFMHYYTKEDT